jgi:hypothetical protein
MNQNGYEYQIDGIGGDGRQTWSITGRIEAAGRENFMDVVSEVMRDGFMMLSDGKAVSAPYNITKLVIAESKEDANKVVLVKTRTHGK